MISSGKHQGLTDYFQRGAVLRAGHGGMPESRATRGRMGVHPLLGLISNGGRDFKAAALAWGSSGGTRSPI